MVMCGYLGGLNMSTKVKMDVEEFNTNNDWGFGGGVGKMVRIGAYACRFGKAYYRHLPSESFARFFRFDGERRIEIGEKEFKQGTGMSFKDVKTALKSA
jgi:hypothetical protein